MTGTTPNHGIFDEDGDDMINLEGVRTANRKRRTMNPLNNSSHPIGQESEPDTTPFFSPISRYVHQPYSVKRGTTSSN